MFVSANREIPDTVDLDYRVEIAMSELKEIPEIHLTTAFMDAKAAAGAFLPTNGQILGLYRGNTGKRQQEAFKALAEQNRQQYQIPKETEGEPKMTEEELKSFFEGIRNNLKSP